MGQPVSARDALAGLDDAAPCQLAHDFQGAPSALATAARQPWHITDALYQCKAIKYFSTLKRYRFITLVLYHFTTLKR